MAKNIYKRRRSRFDPYRGEIEHLLAADGRERLDLMLQPIETIEEPFVQHHEFFFAHFHTYPGF